MNKIWLVIKREYLTRVRKRSFIVMTVLGPLLIAAFYGGLILVSLSGEETPHNIMVVDNSESGIGDELRAYNLQNPKSKLKFVYKYDNLNEASDHLFEEDYNSILFIPRDPVSHPGDIYIKYKDRLTLNQKAVVDNQVERIITRIKLEKYNLTEKDYQDLGSPLIIFAGKANKDGSDEPDDTMPKIALGFAFAFIIYMFILLYGVQVLRGVMEEKTNRIIEVMVSSVRPFQLMMGKIVGIALVGLTQFVIWMLLAGGTISIISALVAPDVMQQVQSGSMQTQQELGGVNIGGFMDVLFRMNMPVMLLTFVFYFLTGYLLYSALFAAVGSAIDSESDSQQFMLPITIPLIFSIAVAQFVLNNPTGIMAKVFSFIPFTAPVVMMVRMPFNPPLWEVGVSAGMMILGFLGTTWLAARIYRTGILMYGKKVTYRELFKWLFYKN